MNQNARVYTEACMRCVCVGWPGAPYSVDICEGLEDWSGANSLSNPSDTEEEDATHLVRHPTLTYFGCVNLCRVTHAFFFIAFTFVLGSRQI